MLAFLRDLGLTRLQAECYLCLVMQGRSKASRLAKELELIRPEVYRILSELVKKGLVTKFLANPAQYEASNAEYGLHRLLMEFSHKARDLATKYEEIRSLIEKRTVSTETPQSDFKLLPGRGRVIKSTLEMINRAQSYFDVVYSKWGMARLTKKSSGLRALAAANIRGVRIRIVTEIDKSNSKQISAVRKYSQVRNADNIAFYINICDGKEVAFGPKLTDVDSVGGAREADLWTNNNGFVTAFQGMFDRLWEAGTPYRSKAQM